MKRVLVFALAVAACSNAFGVDLYNQLAQTYDSGNGAWDGGLNSFGSNAGLQAGQRVTGIGASGRLITGVSGIFVTTASDMAATGALVQVFNLSGNTVGSLIGQQTLTLGTGLSYTNLGTSLISGFNAGRLDATVSIDLGAANNGLDFLVVLQGQGPNWNYLVRDTINNPVQNTFGRDFSSFGYPGGYNTTTFTEFGALGFGSGNANMRVQAAPVPEPASVAALALGAAALLRRRRRS